MRRWQIVVLAILAVWVVGAGSIEQQDGELIVSGARYVARLDLGRKLIRQIALDGSDIGFRSSFLWAARFRDNAEETSAQAELVDTRVDGDLAKLTFRGRRADVVVSIRAGDAALDVSGVATVKSGELIEFATPQGIEFNVVGDGAVLCQVRGRANYGLKLKAPFFARRDVWVSEGVSSSYGQALFGGVAPGARMNPPRIATVARPDLWKFLTPAQYAEATSPWTGKGIALHPYWPFPAGRLDLELLHDEQGGVVLGASRCGGTDGALFRFGGRVEGRALVRCAIRTLGLIARNRTTAARGTVVLISGVDEIRPPFTVSIANWLENLAAVGVKPELVTRPEDVLKALADPSTAAVINPYGEGCLVPTDMDMGRFCGLVGDYVRGGGYWMEINGRNSFSQRIVRKPGHLRLDPGHVPSSFADFFHVDTGRGPSTTVAFGSVQPEKGEPFAGLTDKTALFAPTHAQLRAVDFGGHLERCFVAYAKAGESWTSPVTRFRFGLGPHEAAAAYCRDNGWDRPLASRYEPTFLKRVLARPLVLAGDLGGEAYHRDVYKLGILPPCLFHLCNYTHGDFDKQYPDFLPPLPRWGTADEFAQLYAVARQHDSYLVPYTNPTFWCDRPPGPTFQAAGREPLQRDLDGKEVWEQWIGWATCLWHPAVRAANDRNVRLYTDAYDTEILFQDQVAARGLVRGPRDYDMNPSSPTPAARVAGFIAQARQDDRRAGNDHALATEDMSAPFMTHFIFGAGNDFAEAAILEWYPRETFELYNFVGLVSHDKTEMFFHPDVSVDSNYRLAKALGLGNGLTYVARIDMSRADIDWAHWLAEIQKRVIARHVGRPMRSFRHRWLDRADSLGCFEAEYGDIRVVANLQDKALKLDDFRTLHNHGYLAESVDGRIRLGLVNRLGPFTGRNAYLLDGDDLLILASPGQKAMFPSVPGLKGVTLDGETLPLEIRDGAARLTLPQRLYEGWEHLWRLKLVRR